MTRMDGARAGRGADRAGGADPVRRVRRARALRRRRLLHPGAGRRAGRARLRHQPRGRPAVRRAGRARARRVVATSSAQPDPFLVIEAGAGRGRLAADVLARDARRARRRCATCSSSARRRSRAAQRDLLTRRAVRGRARTRRARRRRRAATRSPGMGPIVTALDELPAVPLDGVVLANELLDNLPFRIVERTADGWSEVRVGARRRRVSSRTLVPAADELAAEADARRRGDRAATAPASRCRPRSASWLQRCASALRRGVLVRRSTTPPPRRSSSRAASDGWLRTYRDHGRGDAPLVAPGEQDITIDVPLEYLVHAAARAGLPAASTTPRRPSGCASLGVDELVADARDEWDARAPRRRPRGAAPPQPRHRGRRAHRSRPGSAPTACSSSPGDRRDDPGSLTAAAVRTEPAPRRGSVMADERSSPTRSSRCSPRDARSRRPPGFAADALRRRPPCLRRGRRRLRGVLGAAGGRAPRLVRAVAHRPRVGPPVREVVRRREAQRLVQLPRPSRRRRPRRPGRVPLGGRAGRHPHHHLRASCSHDVAPARQRAEGARRREGRPGQHLPGHGARAARWRCSRARASAPRTRSCSAASRPTRCATASRTPRPRCSSPATARGGAAASCRSRRRPTPRWPSARRIEKVLVLRRTGQDVAMADGRDVWWHDLVPQQSADCAPEPMDAEDLLYLLYTSGHDGAAQGHHAHDRRLPHAGRVDAQARLRPPRPTPTSTGARPTSAGSPGTRTSSTDRSRTGATSVLYEGTPDHPDKDRLWQIVEKYGVTILYTAPTAIRTFMKWGTGVPGSATTSRRCGCSAASASRSTPKRGSGTGSTSAASAARSSTRGGRPRPAPS